MAWPSNDPSAGGAGYAAPTGPTGPTGPQKLKPAGWWYLIGALVMVVGVGGSVAWFGVAAVGYVNDLTDSDRIAPGTSEVVTLSEGDWFVFREDGGGFAGPGLDIEITDPSGSPVVLRNPTGTLEFETGAESFQAVSEFRARSAGAYTVTVSGGGFGGEFDTGGFAGPGVVIAPSPATLGVVFVATAGIGTVSFIVGLVILIVVGVKRSRNRKQMVPMGGWGPPPGPGGPPPGPGMAGPQPQPGQAPPGNPAWPQGSQGGTPPAPGQAPPAPGQAPPAPGQGGAGWPQQGSS